MSEPYDPMKDPESFLYQKALRRSAAAQPYDASSDRSSGRYRDLRKPVAGSLISGILLAFIAAPAIWGIAVNIYGINAVDGSDPVAVLILGRLAAVVVFIIGLVRFLSAVRVLAERSDRAAAGEPTQ